MTLLTLKVALGCHLTIKIKIFKVNNKINRNIFVPTVCALSTQNVDRAQTVGPVYYCLGNPYNTISSGDLKFYVDFEEVTYKPIEHYDFVDPQGCSWMSPYHKD